MEFSGFSTHLKNLLFLFLFLAYSCVLSSKVSHFYKGISPSIFLLNLTFSSFVIVAPLLRGRTVKLMMLGQVSEVEGKW